MKCSSLVLPGLLLLHQRTLCLVLSWRFCIYQQLVLITMSFRTLLRTKVAQKFSSNIYCSVVGTQVKNDELGVPSETTDLTWHERSSSYCQLCSFHLGTKLEMCNIAKCWQSMLFKVDVMVHIFFAYHVRKRIKKLIVNKTKKILLNESIERLEPFLPWPRTST